jgi:hypothetical protein
MCQRKTMAAIAIGSLLGVSLSASGQTKPAGLASPLALQIFIGSKDSESRRVLAEALKVKRVLGSRIRLAFSFTDGADKTNAKRLLCLPRHFHRTKQWIAAALCFSSSAQSSSSSCLGRIAKGPLGKVSIERFEQCVKGKEGAKLLQSSLSFSQKHKARKKSITIGGKAYAGIKDYGFIVEAICKKLGKKKPAVCGQAPAYSVGVVSCDLYLASYAKCVASKVPAAAKGAMGKSFDTIRQTWRKVPPPARRSIWAVAKRCRWPPRRWPPINAPGQRSRLPSPDCDNAPASQSLIAITRREKTRSAPLSFCQNRTVPFLTG